MFGACPAAHFFSEHGSHRLIYLFCHFLLMNPLPPLPRTPATPLHGLALLQLPRQSWPESHQDQAQTLEGAGPGCPFPKKHLFWTFWWIFWGFQSPTGTKSHENRGIRLQWSVWSILCILRILRMGMSFGSGNSLNSAHGNGSKTGALEITR